MPKVRRSNSGTAFVRSGGVLFLSQKGAIFMYLFIDYYINPPYYFQKLATNNLMCS